MTSEISKNLGLYSVCDGLSEKQHKKSYLELRFFRLPDSWGEIALKFLKNPLSNNFIYKKSFRNLKLCIIRKKLSKNLQIYQERPIFNFECP